MPRSSSAAGACNKNGDTHGSINSDGVQRSVEAPSQVEEPTGRIVNDHRSAVSGEVNTSDPKTDKAQDIRNVSADHPSAEEGQNEAAAPFGADQLALTMHRFRGSNDSFHREFQEVGATEVAQGSGALPSEPPSCNMDVEEVTNQKSPSSEFGTTDHAENPPSQAFPEVEDPSFSLGVTQEGRTYTVMSACPIAIISPSETKAAEANEGRKSKRNRVTPAGFQDFQCDPKIMVPYNVIPDVGRVFEELAALRNPIEFIIIGDSFKISTREFLDIAHRRTQMAPKVMDVVMAYLGSHISGSVTNAAIFDSSLPAAMKDNYSRFVKTVKDRHRVKFSQDVINRAKASAAERLYFPFNIDQHHWIGVCIDSKVSIVHVIDCNTALKTDAQLKKELTPIANMSPYNARPGKAATSSDPPKPFVITRSRSIPPIHSPTDAAVMTALLIQVHSSLGPGGCKGLTPRVLPDAAKQLLVKIYNSPFGRKHP
ncbi:hypothetical protein Bca101_068317 [Brassica carinata]